MGKLTKDHRFTIISSFTLLGILIGVIALPVLSLVIFSILDAIFAKKMDPTISIAVSFLWVPILGTIIGFLAGIRVAISQIKRYENIDTFGKNRK